jgi:hypothetical protein
VCKFTAFLFVAKAENKDCSCFNRQKQLNAIGLTAGEQYACIARLGGWKNLKNSVIL